MTRSRHPRSDSARTLLDHAPYIAAAVLARVWGSLVELTALRRLGELAARVAQSGSSDALDTLQAW